VYVLDTDTYSNFLRGHEQIKRRVSQTPIGSVYLCAITPEEMLRGRLDYINQLRTRKDSNLPLAYDLLLDLVRELNRISILRYDDDTDKIFQAWSAQIKRAGSQDCRIAATAFANGFTVVTGNVAHFAKITDRYEDWGR
jgi:tRNA(fMet)-specific endonuclease VapC